MDCLFCKIIAGAIPSTKVYEDDLVFAFLDIHPKNFGHTLVVPKTHHEMLLDLPESLLGGFLGSVQQVARAIVYATKADGFNLAMNNGEAAGQLIPHAHMHIIPRHAGDFQEHHRHLTYKTGEAELLAQKIKESLE